MKKANLTWKEVSARRMARQRLLAPAEDETAADIVAAMCGAHAQVMPAAEISVALRMAGATRQTVRQALWEEHSLVKTFGPRATVHLLPTRDLPVWTAALATTPEPHGNVPEEARLSPEQSEAVVTALATALADDALTAEELDEAIVASTGAWAGERVVPAWYENLPRWRPAIYTAARRGVLCYGPPRKRKVTYTNPRRWLPEWEAWDGESAARELVRRYLYAYGPATPQQVARWLATPVGWASAVFESLQEALASAQIEGEEAWALADDSGEDTRAAQGLQLLPYFDAFVVGSYPREKLFPGKAAERALAGGQAGNYPVLLVDGVVAGVWHQRRSGRKVSITVEPLQQLSAAQQQALEEQVARIGEIVEARPQWTIGEISVGPHA